MGLSAGEEHKIDANTMRMNEQESSMNNKETKGDAAGEENNEATITASII